MNVRACLIALVATPLLLIEARPAGAVGLTVSDDCGASIGGNTNTTVIVRATGDIEVKQFAGSYAAGVGQCDTPAADNKPRCTVSASKTVVEVGETVSLFAKCSTPTAYPIQSYSWSSPPGGPAPSLATQMISLQFPAAGAFSYSVSATNNSSPGVAGPMSAPVTILVGSTTDPAAKPTCSLTLSPNSITQGQATSAIVTCQPPATQLVWDAPDPSATVTLPLTQPGGLITFPSPGQFTLRVAGAIGSGSPGLKASAMVNVVGTQPACSDGPVINVLGAVPAAGVSGDILLNLNTVGAFSFTATGGEAVVLDRHSQYGTYGRPTQWTYSISQCKGDFSATQLCGGARTSSNYRVDLVAPSCPGVVPGGQYYLNIRPTACPPGNTCGFKFNRF